MFTISIISKEKILNYKNRIIKWSKNRKELKKKQIIKWKTEQRKWINKKIESPKRINKKLWLIK